MTWMQRALRLAFWLAAAFAFVMASLPKPPAVPLSLSDKVLHMLAFATLAGLGSLAYPKMSPLRIALGLFAFGALIEFVQMIPALHRDAQFLDWIADAAAATVVLLAIHVWRRLRRRAAPGQSSRG